MSAPRVALVSRDPDTRLRMAVAFDAAPTDWVIGLFESPPPDADAVVVGDDVDIDGVRFEDDAEALLGRVRRVLDVSNAAKTFVVTSASGGAGTTTVGLHLASFLRRSRDTCVVELDPNEGVSYRLDLAMPEDTPAKLGLSKEELLRAAVPVPGGFRVLPYRIGQMDRVVERCRKSFASFVVDAGTRSPDTTLLMASTANVLVVPPTVPGACRARSLLDRYPDAPWAIVTNRLGPGSNAPTATLESILGRRIAVRLPCTPSLRDAEDEGSLLTSRWLTWVRRLELLAARLERL